jgi:hypothetical protein
MSHRHAPKKHQALTFIHHYKQHRPPSIWKYVKAAKLAAELEQRIEDPSCIKQHGSSWCGPAAVCSSLAGDDPLAYAKMVVHLVRHGHATIHAGVFNVASLYTNAELRHYAFADTKIESADWVPLATLRESVRHDKNHSLKWYFSHGTFPNDITRLYRDMGYTRIYDHTSELNLTGPHAYQYVQQVNAFFHHNYRITMRINADLLSPSTQDNNKGVARALVTHNHWVDLIAPIRCEPPHGPESRVSLEVFSWGKETKGAKVKGLLVPEKGTLTLAAFASNYFGFVAAKY